MPWGAMLKGLKMFGKMMLSKRSGGKGGKKSMIPMLSSLIASFVVVLVVVVILAFNYFICTVTFGLAGGDVCKDDRPISEKEIEDFVGDIRDKREWANEQADPGYKGASYMGKSDEVNRGVEEIVLEDEKTEKSEDEDGINKDTNSDGDYDDAYATIFENYARMSELDINQIAGLSYVLSDGIDGGIDIDSIDRHEQGLFNLSLEEMRNAKFINHEFITSIDGGIESKIDQFYEDRENGDHSLLQPLYTDVSIRVILAQIEVAERKYGMFELGLASVIEDHTGDKYLSDSSLAELAQEKKDWNELKEGLSIDLVSKIELIVNFKDKIRNEESAEKTSGLPIIESPVQFKETNKWNDDIVRLSEKHNVDPMIVKTIMAKETGGIYERNGEPVININKNGTEDLGLMQINSIWLDDGSFNFNREKLINDPIYNLESSIRLIKNNFMVVATNMYNSSEDDGGGKYKNAPWNTNNHSIDPKNAFSIFWLYNGYSKQGYGYAKEAYNWYLIGGGEEPEPIDITGDIDEAELHVRALSQTDFYFMVGQNPEELKAELKSGNEKWLDTELHKTYLVSKEMVQEDERSDWTFEDRLLNARFLLYKCALVGDQPNFKNGDWINDDPCQELDSKFKDGFTEDRDTKEYHNKPTNKTGDMTPEIKEVYYGYETPYIEKKDQGMARQLMVEKQKIYQCVAKETNKTSTDGTRPDLKATENNKATTIQTKRWSAAGILKEDKINKNLVVNIEYNPYYEKCGENEMHEEQNPNIRTSVINKDLVYDVLLKFEPYSLHQPGLTISEDDYTYSELIIQYLRELYLVNGYDPNKRLIGSSIESGDYGFSVPISPDDFDFYVTDDYGTDRENGRHGGMDIGVPIGTPLRAPFDSTVHYVNEDRNGPCGVFVTLLSDEEYEIDYGNGQTETSRLFSRYCHMDSESVRTGQTIKKGNPIGRSGNTGRSSGPHLHFEMCLEKDLKGGICNNGSRRIGDNGDPRSYIDFPPIGYKNKARAYYAKKEEEEEEEVVNETTRSPVVAKAAIEFLQNENLNKKVKGDNSAELIHQMLKENNLVSPGRTFEDYTYGYGQILLGTGLSQTSYNPFEEGARNTDFSKGNIMFFDDERIAVYVGNNVMVGYFDGEIRKMDFSKDGKYRDYVVNHFLGTYSVSEVEINENGKMKRLPSMTYDEYINLKQSNEERKNKFKPKPPVKRSVPGNGTLNMNREEMLDAASRLYGGDAYMNVPDGAWLGMGTAGTDVSSVYVLLVYGETNYKSHFNLNEGEAIRDALKNGYRFRIKK